MYRVIAVDDEALALRRFKHILENESRLELLETFTNPETALEYVKNNAIDIAFLDIEMPGINGLELAERIQEIDPYVSIIFVTAFDQYALDAFKAHAIGYLLKPLDKVELTNQIALYERTRTPRSNKDELASNTKKIIVNCFGQFSCYIKGNESEAITFRTAKATEIFAFLIHHYDSMLSKYAILDALFPDMDYEKSNKLFYVSCSYLRNAFTKVGVSNILIRENDNYRVNLSLIDCDYIQFIENQKHYKELSLEELNECSLLYKGEYLLGKSYEWAFESKPYIENMYKTLQLALTNLYIEKSRRADAYQALERLIVQIPLDEEPIAKLMQMKVEDGQKEAAVNIYRNYAAKLEEALDTEPSPHLRAIIR